MEHVKKREEISKEFTWALEDLYQDQAAWSEDLEKIRKLAQELYSCKGTLVEGAENLKKALNFYSELNQRFEKAYVYANQLLHQDMTNGESQKCSGQVQVLMNQVNEVSAFLEPEILKIPDEKLTEYLADEPFSEYRRFLEEILRTKEHSLSEEKEELLARVSELGRAPSNIYGMFNNADITFQPVKDENGNEQPLTQERYVHYLENKNREIRKEAFTNLYSGYKGFANTIAAVFDANVRQAAFFAKERKYSSSLEAALDGGNIPISVYTNLIRTVEEHQQPMQRYLELRKRLLGVEQLHMYDVYVPMIEKTEKKYSFEEAKHMVLNALSVLGSEYTGLLEKGFHERWIDIYENEGKRSGAYSWGAYGTHPYVLLNYQGNLNHVFTLAHEMGHALHSWYSDHAQNYLNAGYRIFVAEVASTCNEALLIHDLMEKTEDKKEKTVMDLITLQQKKDLFPVGRLDKDTEGLLLVTNDGELAHRLLSPKKHVDKCYFTRVTGQIHEEDIHRFKEGLDIGDEKKTLPADLEILSSGEISEAKVTICEGRYHQVKRMFEAIGCKVIYLKRLSMGSLTLDPALEKGAFRKLTEEEIAALLQPPRKEKE